ncbi:hypothetical protein T07_12080 [Trichinella nelsoni]|uniref:Uncharacterized protein n=1 Tax=Trichinella nelsoni TaxID=6336 RepID=A0A0V0RVQ1_9BILA|nr:hypothetical protein T07_12080 [Trichinella nelsoni]
MYVKICNDTFSIASIDVRLEHEPYGCMGRVEFLFAANFAKSPLVARLNRMKVSLFFFLQPPPQSIDHEADEHGKWTKRVNFDFVNNATDSTLCANTSRFNSTYYCHALSDPDHRICCCHVGHSREF